MDILDDVFDSLWEEEWLKIPDTHYLIKYKFSEDGYALILTNLSETYGEKLADEDLTGRFSTLNPYATMKPKVIVSKIKWALHNALSEPGAEIGVVNAGHNLTLHLRFNLCATVLYFDFHPQLLSCEQVRTHLIAPIILTSLQTFQENLLLKDKINNLEKKTAVLGPSYSREDNKALMSMISTLNKRSRADVTEILDSFLQLQKNMKKDILDVKKSFDRDGANLPESSHIEEFTTNLFIKEEVKDPKPLISRIPFIESEQSTSRPVIKEEVKHSKSWFAYEDEANSQLELSEAVVCQQSKVVMPQSNARDVKANPISVIRPENSVTDKCDGDTSTSLHSGQVKKKKKLLNI